MKNDLAERLLGRLNSDYAKIHKKYENLFWRFYMGEQSLEKKFNEATAEIEKFRTNKQLTDKVAKAAIGASGEIKKRLNWWKKFFELNQTPEELVPLRKEIIELESEIHKKRNFRKEGYIDPKTKEFVAASSNKMGTMMATADDEEARKACFEAIEKLSVELVDEYVKLVKLRNEFAKRMGYDDFYDYRLKVVEGATKEEVFGIFKEIFERTKYAFKDIRKMEKTIPGLRKPWNFRYLTSGNFIKEEDQYFQFDKALMNWGQSFAAMGINYNGGTLQLDLLDRKGKYNNGFCHYQDVVYQKGKKFTKASADFTCNTVIGQVGSGVNGLRTLFHEGAHAADRLNSRQKDAILNTEYPPASVSWAETHSQFCDTIMSGIDWRTRYAKNAEGKAYPFELFEKKVRKLQPFSPLGMMGIMFVSEFEKEIYEAKDLTREKVLEIAIEMDRKYFDMEVDSYYALYIPHIYSWDSSAYYHGYGLSELAVYQWREYFYEKYGYIVDNPNVGREMKMVWKLGSTRTFLEFVKIATGKELSTEPYISNVTRGIEETLALAKKRIKKLESVPEYTKRIKLEAKIKMVHGKKVICDSTRGFENMAAKYSEWLKKQ